MICYKDQTFCVRYPNACANDACLRAFTSERAAEAAEWWKEGEPPVCWSDFPECRYMKRVIYSVKITPLFPWESWDTEYFFLDFDAAVAFFDDMNEETLGDDSIVEMYKGVEQEEGDPISFEKIKEKRVEVSECEEDDN